MRADNKQKQKKIDTNNTRKNISQDLIYAKKSLRTREYQKGEIRGEKEMAWGIYLFR
jgi:hypothetical protein